MRRTGIEENAKRLEQAIRTHGYRNEHPVLLRPEPNQPDQYDYEVVAGQSRFKGACLAELEAIPAVIEDIDDEEAHLLSYRENEDREQLSAGDKIYWYEQRFKTLREEGHQRSQAIEGIARFYDVTKQTVENYLVMVSLPQEIVDDIDHKVLTAEIGRAISRKGRLVDDEAQAEAAMIEAGGWAKRVPNRYRGLIRDAIDALEGPMTEQNLQEALDQIVNRGPKQIGFATTPETMRKLEAYALKFGYLKAEDILPMIIAQALENAGVE